MPDMTPIPVMPYIRKYVWHTYGPGDRFKLHLNPRNPLRIALLGMDMSASIAPQPDKLASHCLYLDLGEDAELHAAFHRNQAWLKLGAFMQHEFRLHLRHYIDAQRKLALKFGISDSDWNARIGLECFLEHYNIEEHEYSYESLRRQWTRVKDEDTTFFSEKASRLYEFRRSDNQVVTNYYIPAHLVGKSRFCIVFHAFSRSNEDIVKREARIPPNIARDKEALTCYADNMMRAINYYLKRGYTIA